LNTCARPTHLLTGEAWALCCSEYSEASAGCQRSPVNGDVTLRETSLENLIPEYELFTLKRVDNFKDLHMRVCVSGQNRTHQQRY
jgi:hypothetical protein